MLIGVEVDDPADLVEALALHRLVVVRGQRIGVDEQVRITASLGRVVGTAPGVPQVRYEDDRHRHPDDTFFNQQWHADLSWCAEGPTVTLLHGLVIGRGAAPTAFVDTISGFARLSGEERAAAAGWSARHHVERSRVLRHGRGSPPQGAPRRRHRPAGEGHDVAVPTYVDDPGASHAVVVGDPASGRAGVLLGDHAWTLDGMPEPDGRRVVEALQARIVAGGDRHVHRWRRGDLVVFDNRTLLHRREPTERPGRRRVLRRTVAWPCPQDRS